MSQREENFAEACWRAMKALKEVLDNPLALGGTLNPSEYFEYHERAQLLDAGAALGRAAIKAAQPAGGPRD